MAELTLIPLSPKMSEQALSRYIQTFLDKDRMSVQTYMMLEKLRRNKGQRRSGYMLWDYYATDRRRRPYIISENTFRSYTHKLSQVLVYWDCTYVGPTSPFAAHNGVCMAQYAEIASHLDICPPTLYLFDQDYQWSLVRTDEPQNEDNWNCLQIGEIGSRPRRAETVTSPAAPASSPAPDGDPLSANPLTNLIMMSRKLEQL